MDGDEEEERGGLLEGPPRHPRARAGPRVFVAVALGLLAAAILAHETADEPFEEASLQSLAQKTAADGRRSPKVYVYELPSRFNRDLYECRYRKTLEDRGLGYGTYVGDVLDMALYTTDQFDLEAVFHARLMARKDLLVSDPALADIFYVPYYSQLAFFCLRSRPSPGTPASLLPFFAPTPARLHESLHAHLAKSAWLGRRLGADHASIIAAIGREAVDASCQYNDCFGSVPWVENFTVGAIEQIGNYGYKTARIVPVPYTSGLHCRSPETCGAPATLDDAERPIFAFFIGCADRSPVREIAVASLKALGERDVRIVDPSGTNGFMVHSLEFQQLMGNSTFCLEPTGDSPTRKGFYDALLVGCVPVIFSRELSASVPYPTKLHARLDEFTVYVDDPKRTPEILRNVSQQQLASLRRAGRRVAWQLNYAMPNAAAMGDAVDLFLEEVQGNAQRSR